MRKRPFIITAICIIGFVSSLVSFITVFSPSIKKLGIFMPAVYGLIISATFVSFIGIWHMKRWGPELYSFSFFGKMLFFLFTGTFTFGSFIGILFSAWYMITFLVYYRKMDVNL